MKAEKITPTIINPVTSHSIEDRRALTKDALKLSAHELKKEFERRIKDIVKKLKDTWDDTESIRDEYNMAVADNIMTVGMSTRDNILHSFNVINALRDDDSDDDAIEVTVHIGSVDTFFKGSKEGTKKFVERLGSLLPDGWGVHCEYRDTAMCDLDMLRIAAHIEEHDETAYDDTVPVSITISKDNSDVDIDRTLDITCTKKLADARQALVAPANAIRELNAKLTKAEEDLDNLPAMMTELDMSATAMRLQAAGGEQFLGQIMIGVQRIMAGETELSGLRLAMGNGSEATSE